MTDRALLYASAFLRSLATGMAGILLGLYLARLRLQPGEAGLVVGAGLAGTAAAAGVATLLGDRLGRRRCLVLLALLSALGGAALLFAESLLALCIAAFLGMVNGMGRDRGAALILEQAALPATAADTERTRAFAVYNVWQDAGHALGSLLAAVPALLGPSTGDSLSSSRGGLAGQALLCAAIVPIAASLSSGIETQQATKAKVSVESRKILVRISALFALDSLGGGFLTGALLSVFFFERFGVAEAALAPLFFGARVANAVSHLVAARLARRFGLVNTMVFTHIPSSLLLVTVAYAPSFEVAAALFLLREGLVEMDVPTRQSYVMAVVRPEERTIASGTTQLVRLAAWAVAAPLAGALMQGWSLTLPLLVAATLKIAYDILLYASFRRIRPPEEEPRSMEDR